MADIQYIDVMPSGPVQVTLEEGASRAYVMSGRRLLGILRSIYDIDARVAAGEQNLFYSCVSMMQDGSIVRATYNNGQDCLRISPPTKHFKPVVQISPAEIPPVPEPPVPSFAEHVFPLKPPVPEEPPKEDEDVVTPSGFAYVSTFSGVTVKVDLRTGESLGQFVSFDEDEMDGYHIALSPDGTRLYMGTWAGYIDVYDTATFGHRERFLAAGEDSDARVVGIHCAPNGDGSVVAVVEDGIEYPPRVVKLIRSGTGDEDSHSLTYIELPTYVPSGYIWDTSFDTIPADPYIHGLSGNRLESPFQSCISKDGTKLFILESGFIGAVYPPLFPINHVNPTPSGGYSRFYKAQGIYVINVEVLSYTIQTMPAGPFDFSTSWHAPRSNDGAWFYSKTNAASGHGSVSEFDPALANDWTGEAARIWMFNAATGAAVGTVANPFPVDWDTVYGYDQITANGEGYFVDNGDGALNAGIHVIDLITGQITRTIPIWVTAFGDTYEEDGNNIIIPSGDGGLNALPSIGTLPSALGTYEGMVGGFAIMTDASAPYYANNPVYSLATREVLVAETGVPSPYPRLVFEIKDANGLSLQKTVFKVTTPPDVYRYLSESIPPSKTHFAQLLEPYVDDSPYGTLTEDVVEGTPIIVAEGLNEVYLIFKFDNSGPPGFPGDVATSSDVEMWIRSNPLGRETNILDLIGGGSDPPDETFTLLPDTPKYIEFPDPEAPLAYTLT